MQNLKELAQVSLKEFRNAYSKHQNKSYPVPLYVDNKTKKARALLVRDGYLIHHQKKDQINPKYLKLAKDLNQKQEVIQKESKHNQEVWDKLLLRTKGGSNKVVFWCTVVVCWFLYLEVIYRFIKPLIYRSEWYDVFFGGLMPFILGFIATVIYRHYEFKKQISYKGSQGYSKFINQQADKLVQLYQSAK